MIGIRSSLPNARDWILYTSLMLGKWNLDPAAVPIRPLHGASRRSGSKTPAKVRDDSYRGRREQTVEVRSH